MKGINGKFIIKESKSTDTIENSKYCLKKMKRYNFKDGTVLTSEFHKKMTSFIFNHYFEDKYKLNFVSSKNGISKDEINRDSGALTNRDLLTHRKTDYAFDTNRETELELVDENEK